MFKFGVIEEYECLIILGVVWFVDCLVCEVMMLCIDIDWFDCNWGLDEICEMLFNL